GRFFCEGTTAILSGGGIRNPPDTDLPQLRHTGTKLRRPTSSSSAANAVIGMSEFARTMASVSRLITPPMDLYPRLGESLVAFGSVLSGVSGMGAPAFVPRLRMFDDLFAWRAPMTDFVKRLADIVAGTRFIID
ncbi:hypothetical protein ACFYPN_33300, partial [Streptomyces sp. NPDC005576]